MCAMQTSRVNPSLFLVSMQAQFKGELQRVQFRDYVPMPYPTRAPDHEQGTRQLQAWSVVQWFNVVWKIVYHKKGWLIILQNGPSLE